MIHDSRRRAKKLGLEHTITYEDIAPLIPEHCPVLGIKLNWDMGFPGGNPNKPSIDRIDSSKGYTLDNIQILSWRANDLKADGTPEEILKLAKFLSEVKE